MNAVAVKMLEVAGVCAVLALLSGAVAACGLRLFVRRMKSRLEYTEIRCRPLSVAELPRAVRRDFERREPELQRLGFRQLGDFFVEGVAYTRRFLSGDGATVGEIAVQCLGPLPVLRVVDFFSVLEDGTYLESGDNRIPAVPAGAAERFRLTGYPSWTAEGLYRQHETEVERVASGQDAAILILEPDVIDQLVDYGQRLVVWARRHESGVEPGPPPRFPLAAPDAPAERIA